MHLVRIDFNLCAKGCRMFANETFGGIIDFYFIDHDSIYKKGKDVNLTIYEMILMKSIISKILFPKHEKIFINVFL